MELTADLLHIENAIHHIVPAFRNKAIFITGGTGFIGKWILETLCYLNTKHDLSLSVTVLSRNPAQFLRDYPQFEGVQFIYGDIRSFDFPDDQFDYIIHAATEASATLNVEAPLLMCDVICDGTRRVLEMASRNKNCKLLFLSSGAVYGIMPSQDSAFSEDFGGAPNPLLPGSAYGEAKRIAEMYCATYAREGKIQACIARCFAFVGPYLSLDTHFAIGNFIGNGLKKEPIIIHGDGMPLRSYLYTSDLVIWLLTILINGKNGEAYNVGSDEPVSIKQLAKTVADFFPDLEIKVLNQTRKTDRNQNYIPDITKSKTELGLSVSITLKEAIEKTISYHQQ